MFDWYNKIFPPKLQEKTLLLNNLYDVCSVLEGFLKKIVRIIHVWFSK